MNIVNRVLSVCLGNVCNLHRRKIVLLLAVFSLGHAGSVFAINPPENIRLEDNVLRWDAVEDAANYNVYYLSGPVVDNSVTPRYVATVGNVREFRPTTDGFYTIVTVANNGLEFSNVADGASVAFDASGDSSPPVSSFRLVEVRSVRCDNVVSGGTCESQCSFAAISVPTGGACRADAGVVLHQRAQRNGFQCISQNDTSFVEVDVYCLNYNNF